MKKTFLVFIIILVVMLILNINFPLKKQDIYGKYINKNFDNPVCCVEAPHMADTLTLYENKTFESNFYGVGTYKLYNGINPEIELYYKDFDQSAVYKTYFSNEVFENPKIMETADPSDRISQLKKKISKTFKSNDEERSGVLEILGIIGILHDDKHFGYADRYITYPEREHRPVRNDDVAYPARWWQGKFGIDNEKWEYWFGSK